MNFAENRKGSDERVDNLVRWTKLFNWAKSEETKAAGAGDVRRATVVGAIAAGALTAIYSLTS